MPVRRVQVRPAPRGGHPRRLIRARPGGGHPAEPAGQGAWLHPDRRCLELAERRRAFPRSLRHAGPLDAGAVQDYLERRRG
ncbi:DUF448 domain-containing protein [Cellulomonas sp. ATA003]|nr:DUF448 domain-containing protein [Cellulomonas sp. ATA003]WNB84905.1 DUF448 domain-containing protein [Cellulomonas sp. ATA003]